MKKECMLTLDRIAELSPHRSTHEDKDIDDSGDGLLEVPRADIKPVQSISFPTATFRHRRMGEHNNDENDGVRQPVPRWSPNFLVDEPVGLSDDDYFLSIARQVSLDQRSTEALSFFGKSESSESLSVGSAESSSSRPKRRRIPSDAIAAAPTDDFFECITSKPSCKNNTFGVPDLRDVTGEVCTTSRKPNKRRRLHGRKNAMMSGDFDQILSEIDFL